MTRTQQFIKKYKKVLTSGADFFNPDTSLMKPEDFEKAKCRILMILPTPHVVKTVSSTVAAINDFIITHCPDTFLDVAYMPENEDIKYYDEWNVPYAIGNITHLDASHFDMVGFSISVLNEVVTAPVILSTFNRCDKPIPLFWSQRKDAKLGEHPIVYAGGITAVCGESMFGKVNVNGNIEQAYMDFMYLGDCGQTHILTNRFIEAGATGKCTRKQEDHDVPGYPHTDIENFEEVVFVTTIQDYIESLFDLQEIYHPQAYEVEYNKHNQIIKNIKINPKARDFVTPYYPHIMEPDLGIGRAVINANGDNCGTTQTQVSEGAHMKGNRIRTLNGLVRIEDLCSKEVGDSDCSGTVDTIDGPGKLYHRFTQGVKPVNIFTLKSGIRIGLTDEHPVEQWHIGDENTKFVRADSLKVGDFFMTKKSHVFGSYPMTPDEAEFLGRMVGDGSYNLYQDSREGHNTPTHRMYLSCAWSEKDYCEHLLNRAFIDYTLDESQGRHCRFWIKETDKKGRSMREFWGFNEFYKERDGKPSIKYIPAPAYKLNEEAMKSFLKGCHDADGCTSTKKGISKVTFDCCHESIIDDIQQLLLMVGIPSRKHFNEKSRIADEDYGFHDTVNEHWSLVISSEYFDKFNGLGVLKKAYGRNKQSKEHLPIPSNIRELLYSSNLTTSERSHAFNQVRRNSFTKALADKCGFKYPDVVFDEIVKIETIEAETYDLSVAKLEKLTANGCSVHNCSAGGACSFCSEGNYCLPKGTLIKSTKGLVPIDELKVGDKVVLLDKQLSVLDTVVVGEKPTITFELSNHQKIKVANTHLILTIENGKVCYKRAFSLKEGDFIAYERSESFGSNKTDKAYLVGAVIGDGHFYPEQNLVKVHSPNHEVEEMKINLGWMFCSKHSTSIMRFSKQTKELTKELIDLGLTHETAISKRIPKFFFNADKNTAINLLRGMFDTDGSIKLDSNKRATISYSTVSEKLKDDLVALLSMFGIRASVYKTLHKPHYKSNGEFIKQSPGWEISIFGNENIKRFKTIGFGLSSKQQKLEASEEAAFESDYVPTFEERIKDLYHSNKEFNKQVRKHNDSLRKVVNGWSNMHWLSKRHFQKSFDLLSEDIKNDYLEASKYEFVQITSIEEGPEEMMYDINVEDDHAYSLCGWVSHNTGGWVEKDEEQIMSELREAKKYSAGYKYKPYSFNANYVKDYKGKLAKFIQMYPKVTFINMRMEELGRDVDALKMMKLIGSNRISAPMEGMSPRLQNNLLNKCLSEESLQNFMDDMVHARMTDIKCVTKEALSFVKGKGILNQEEMLNEAKVSFGISHEKTLIANFSRGISIEGTPDHRVLVKPEVSEQNFKELSNLKKGDKVFLKLGANCYGSIQKVSVRNRTNANTSVKDSRDLELEINPEIALMLGWCTGDGSVETTISGSRNRVRFYFNSDELDVADMISTTLKGLGYHSSEGWVKDNVYCISSYYKNFAIFMEEMIGRKHGGKFVNSLILKSPKEVQVSYLKGLMGAGGIVSNIKKGDIYHSTIALTLHNSQITKTIQQMLLNMGIVSRIRNGISRCAGKEFEISSLIILQQHHRLYMSEVGFAGRKNSFKPCELSTSKLIDSVKEVNGFIPVEFIDSEESEAEVYKFQTPDHTYTTNGIVSHNCGGIFTGYEEEEDFQWICDFVDKFKERAAKEGGNFPFRLKMCLTGEALTPIPGVGLVRQIDMQEGPVCGYENSIIKAVRPQGLCEVFELKTKDGTTIKGTPEHPVLVDPSHPERPESYKFIKDLKQGDVIYGKLGTEAYGEETISDDMCKIVGWYLGDGYVNKHDNFKTCGFCFNKEEQDLHDEIWNALSNQGLVPHVHKHKENILAIRVHNAEFSRKLKSRFGHTAFGKTIEPLLRLNKHCQSLILRYWFSADGTVDLDKSTGVSRIKLESVNLEILRDVKVILANMGIGTTLRTHASKYNGKTFTSNTLEIRQPWVKLFSETIGFVGAKQDRIVTRTRKSTKSLVNGFVKMFVESSEQVADEMTYGFTVENGTYVTNGIVSHNTPLVHYPLTPIEYLERKSARKSYNGEHWLTDEWYEKFREHQVYFKVNGFRYSTFLEQTFVDLGRSLTPLIYKHFVSKNAPIYSLRSCATDEYIAELKAFVDKDVYFEDRDPEKYISPCHRIHIELMGSYIPRARRLLRHKKEGNIFANEQDIRCLKTFEGAKVKCYHSCIAKDPLKMYHDVVMDEEGNLHGESYNLTGCQRCPTNEQRKNRLAREIVQTKNSEDIISTRRMPQVQKIRFVLKREEEYDCLNPNNTAHTFMTKFLQLSDNLLDSYHSIICHNMFWQCSPGFKFFTSGYQIVDTMWSKNVISEVKQLIPQVNELLQSVKVVSAEEVLRDEKISITDLNFYTFESSLPRELFDSACHTYKGQIKVEAQVQGFSLTETIDSSLEKPVFASKGGKTIGCFWIPAKYNPVVYLAGFLSQAKKTSEDGVVTTTNFSCKMTMRENKMACKNCSKENALISITTGNVMPFGKSCLCKAILTQMVK